MSKTSSTFIHSLVVALAAVVASPMLWAQGINVSLSPSTATVSVGQTFQFTAKVTPGSKSGVTWNVNGIAGGNSTVGTISSGGLYSAPTILPSPTSVTVSAISTVDSTKSANATVTVVSTGPPTISVTVSPSSASVQVSQTQQFLATVSGTSNTSVTWSVNGLVGGDSTNGTISTSGLFTAPATAPSSTVTVYATSVADSSKFAQAAVTVIGSTLTISPSVTTVPTSQNAQFSVAQTGGSKKPATFTWKVNGIQGGNSAVGTISNKGLYTAPVVPPNPATTTITAISSSNQSGQASATIVQAVSVNVSPASASVFVSQTQQFTAAVSGTSNTAVTWSVNGISGGNSISGTVSSNGLYTAPAGVPVPASVTVTASSVADSTKSASATVNVNPSVTVSVSVSPASVTLSNSQIQQFAANVTGSSSSLVVWSLSAALGAISASGQYQAPSSINGPQMVTVTATTVVAPITSGSARISLMPDTTPPSVSITSPTDPTAILGGTVTLGATASDNVGVVGVQFSVDGVAVGPAVTAPPYSAAWKTLTYQNGVHAISVVARDAAGNTATASANVTVSNVTTQVILPVEVVGGAGTTQTVTVNLASPPVSGARLWMQIHNLKYQTEASVQINGGLWLPINDTTVTLEGLASAYGGIGGGFSTLKLSLALPTGALVPGANTVTFQFSGTDGVTSGFRVLKFNFLDSNGNQLINADTFVQDDPNTWQPPSTLATDIAAGQLLWQTASLTSPSGAIQAKCGSCHTQDGRDLKYFNYSNNSISARAMFHGLSTDQANQIVDYIRSLNVPNPGRPWNPPYQPGPGLDSLPVEQWAAGAGLSAVLDRDAGMMPYLVPGGSTSGWAANQYLNPRELSIAFQLPDWNAWLPKIHPADAYGSSFTGSGFNSGYSTLRSLLQPNDPTSYGNALSYFDNWNVAKQQFLVPIETAGNWDADNNREKLYSAALWQMVKLWEINQEFGLEAMPQVPFGSKANPRGWQTSEAFNTSPNILHITVGPGIGNGTQMSWEYLAYVWYHTQLLLNDGQGKQADTRPLDWGYVEGMIKDVSNYSGGTPAALLEVAWLIKALQEETLNGFGPDYVAYLGGFQPNTMSPVVLVYPDWESTWSDTSSGTRISLTQAYIQTWFAQISSFTASQYYQGKDGNGRPWASAVEDPAQDYYLTEFGGQVWFMLPRLRYIGIDPTWANQISAWAASVWPAGNWALNNTATCSDLGHCTSDQ